MQQATLFKLQVPKHLPSTYEAGVADGAACRRRAGKPSTFLLVAFADDYSAGFRAGYFRDDRGNPTIANVAREERR